MMEYVQIIMTHLLGPAGGLFGLGIGVGILAYGKILEPRQREAHKLQIASMQQRFNDMEASFRAQLAALEANFKSQIDTLRTRVAELEVVEEEYVGILKDRARLTKGGH